MKHLVNLTLVLCVGFVVTVGLVADETPPDEMVFEAKMGNVTFQHAEHIAREGGKCETCHDKLFPQSREAINFKGGMHKHAEEAKTSCAACHHEGGKSFTTKGNCKNCHVKK